MVGKGSTTQSHCHHLNDQLEAKIFLKIIPIHIRSVLVVVLLRDLVGVQMGVIDECDSNLISFQLHAAE